VINRLGGLFLQRKEKRMKNKVLFYFLKELQTATVKVPRGTDFDTIQAGTPLSEAGAIANDATAYGIVMHNHQKEWTREATINGYANVTVITAGYIDEAAAEASCGLEYTDALKGKLADIHFIEGEIGSGGGGGQPTEKTERVVIIPEQTVEKETPKIGDPFYPITADGKLPDTFTLSVDGVAETMVFNSDDNTWLGQGRNYFVQPTQDVGGEGYELYINQPIGVDPPTSVTVIGYTETTTYSGASIPDYTPDDKGKVLTLAEQTEGVLVIPEQTVARA